MLSKAVGKAGDSHDRGEEEGRGGGGGITLLTRLSALGVLTLALLARSLGLGRSPRGPASFFWISDELGICMYHQTSDKCMDTGQTLSALNA